MRAGDTFIRAGKHIQADPHLWVVISKPQADKRCVAVNLTSQRIDKDQSCVIYPGEHPYVTRESVVLYAGARIVLESAILAGVKAGALKLHSRMSAKLLARIQAGAAKSQFLPLAPKRMLQAQGIIALDEPKSARSPEPRATPTKGKDAAHPKSNEPH